MNEQTSLAVVHVVRDALSYSYRNIGELAKLSASWMLLFTAFTLVFQLLGIGTYLWLVDAVAYVRENPFAARAEGYESLEVLTFKLETIIAKLGPVIQIHYFSDKLLRVVLYSCVGVALVDFYLRDTAPPVMRLGRREFRFIKYLIGNIAFVVGCSAAVYYLFDIAALEKSRIGMVVIGGALVLLFLVVRFLPVFPGISVGDAAMSLRRSWALTRGNGWRMFGATLLVLLSSLPISMVKFFIDELKLPMVVGWPIKLFCSLMVLMYLLTFLSICYRFFGVLSQTEQRQPD